MRTIKLFEDFYSTLPGGMKMEDIVKLSPDDFLKLAEETLKRGSGTDQNEFHTMVRAYASENPKFKQDWERMERLGGLIDKYGIDPDALDIPAYGDVDQKKRENEKKYLDDRIKQFEREISSTKIKIARLTKDELPQLERTLAELKAERSARF